LRRIGLSNENGCHVHQNHLLRLAWEGAQTIGLEFFFRRATVGGNLPFELDRRVADTKAVAQFVI
jgi:hypothetical protein